MQPIPLNASHKANQPEAARRRWIKAALGLGASGLGLSMVPQVQVFAQQVQEFVEGPPVPDVMPEQLTPHVWMVYAKEGFPTAENYYASAQPNPTFFADILVVLTTITPK